MKKTIFTLAVLFVFAACDNMAQFKEPIQNLATNWESSTTQVTDFVAMMNNKSAEVKSMMAGMQVPEEMQAYMDEEAKNKVKAMQGQMSEYTNTFGDLNGQVEAFLSKWQEGGETLNELQAGLESGSLPTDVQEKITSLQDMVSNVAPTLEEWNSKMDAAYSGATSTAGEFKAMLEGMSSEG